MSSAEEQLEAKQEERARQRNHEQRQQAHRANMSQQEASGSSVELLREVMGSDLSPGVVRALDNYLSSDFIFSVQRREDLDEFKWLLRNKLIKATQIHPRKGAKIDGKRRAAYLDDSTEDLEPLADSDRMLLRTYGDGVRWRAERSEGGEQLAKVYENHSVVENRDVDEDDEESSGWLGGIV